MRAASTPIVTERLKLRMWRPGDRAPFATMNADPRVMEHFPGLLSRAKSDLLADRIAQHIADKGFGLWAVEVPGQADFIGFIGLSTVTFEAHFTPSIEIGWRLAAPFWGRGYATEGARAALDFGFSHLDLAHIVSFTVAANKASLRVMERLGMRRIERGDFDHPRVPEGHRLRRHVLYRTTRQEWLATAANQTRPTHNRN